MTVRHVWKRLCLTLCLCVLSTAAWGASVPIQVSNRSGQTLSVAVHYLNPQKQWVTEGWWVFEPGELSTLKGIETTNRYLYVYAEGTDDAVWDGRGEKDAVTLWVVDGKFKTLGNRKPAGTDPVQVLFSICEVDDKGLFYVQFDK